MPYGAKISDKENVFFDTLDNAFVIYPSFKAGTESLILIYYP